MFVDFSDAQMLFVALLLLPVTCHFHQTGSGGNYRIISGIVVCVCAQWRH